MNRSDIDEYMRPARRKSVVICAAAFLAIVVFPLATQTQSAGILVGPNIRVSKSSDSPRVELMIAANPKNPKNLIGTAIVGDRDADRCKTYTTFDGGYTWQEDTFSDLPETGSGDPQVAFAADGTAYFSAIGEMRGDDGKNHFAAMLFRSEDGGLTWQKTAVYGSGYGPDHDQMVIDTRKDAAGRIYVSFGYRTRLEDANMGIFRSDDRGKTIIGPLHGVSGSGRGVFNMNPVVFSDGSLFAPFISSERKPIAKRTTPSTDIYFAISDDGGYTFGAPAKIRPQMLDPNYTAYAAVLFAVDSSDRFRDRLYMVWDEAVGEHYHLNFSHSNDRGKTWSVPHEIAAPGADTNQFRPAMAVSSEGVVGLSWFDTHGTPTGREYNEFFTASADGGQTFLPPAKISSRPSSLDAPENLILHPTIDSPRGHSGVISFSFNTVGFRFPDGGDYMGLTADGNGIFHPFWADTRDGSYQAWTAAVKIVSSTGTAGDAAVQKATAAPITEQVSPLFDPARYDAQTGIEEIPVRIKNISENEICKPLIVQIKAPEPAAPASETTEILNSGEKLPSANVTFDYSKSFGSFSCLAPGEATDAIVWRVKPAKNAKSFVSFDIAVTGVVTRPKK